MLDHPRLRFITPAKPRLVETPPSGERWLHEVKFDGYRTQVHVEAGAARAYSSSGADWTRKYPQIVEAASRLACTSAVIDGEVYLPDAVGAADFAGLPAAIRWRPHELVFVAFDLMHLDGQDLRSRPLEERREGLAELLATSPAPCLAFSEAFSADGPEAFAAVDSLGLEGIVSKRLGSRYKSGDSDAWLKTKTFTTSELEVIGADVTPKGLPIALLARRDETGLHYVGNAFITLKAADREAFWHYVEQRQAAAPPLPLKVRGQWVQSGLKATVRHLRGEGMLRAASLKGLRLG